MKAIVDPSLVEKNQCACIPHVIRNKSLKPLICSHWHRILKSKNASAIREVNSGAAGSTAMYVAIVHDPGMVRRRSVLCSHNEPYVSKHRCVWIVDICVISWEEKAQKQLRNELLGNAGWYCCGGSYHHHRYFFDDVS